MFLSKHAVYLDYFNIVRQGYSDRDLIDIPVGRSISVRVQMPENSIWNQQQKKLAEAQ
ncbi:hypothetical protein XNC3_1740016 [Xenorhabdus nematophila F1]|uniref:phage tail fiber protein n=1 Tax=Xenorhabdus nematophila TaxID=628 RepID=UPI0003275A8F|nr:hypothetical protein XNC3_1740016 [Xenorhabdus nematophila F1]